MQLAKALHQDEYIFIDCFKIVDWRNVSDNDFYYAFEYLGGFKNITAFGSLLFYSGDDSLSNIIKRLIKIYLKRQPTSGLLHIFSILAQSGYKSKLPVRLDDLNNFNTSEELMDAIIINLIQPDLTQEDANNILPFILKSINDDNTFSNLIFDIISRNRLYGQIAESIVVEILLNLPKSNWELRQKAIQILDSSTGKRTSQVYTNWEALGLPESLKKLIVIK